MRGWSLLLIGGQGRGHSCLPLATAPPTVAKHATDDSPNQSEEPKPSSSCSSSFSPPSSPPVVAAARPLLLLLLLLLLGLSPLHCHTTAIHQPSRPQRRGAQHVYRRHAQPHLQVIRGRDGPRSSGVGMAPGHQG